MAEPRAEDADIALLLEGTFPYVSGGVSSWVNQVIRAFPEYRFALVFIGSQESDYGEMKYKLPDNVVHLERHYIHSAAEKPRVRAQAGDPATFEMVERLHAYFRSPSPEGEPVIGESLAALSSSGSLSDESFLYSRASWDYTTDQYRRFSRDPSFIDYFWTIRIMHQPLWQLSRVAEQLIPVKAYHTISTGYAGFLAAILKWKTGRPVILSEHGIYTKERKIDLFQSQWIKDNRDAFSKDPAEIGYLRALWIRFFESLGRMCYSASDDIVALYETNRLRQVADGADAARTRNIPNGIDLPRLSKLRALRPADPPPILCLLGRVVPIKDLKTFIRAMRTVVNRMPEAQGWIAGPEDEDPGYVAECRELVQSLGLADSVKFLGFQRIDALLPQVGLLVLSSISEALPLVVLEGYAAGVPVVTTDVGSCRQLVHGLPGEDAAFGAAGRVVGIADPTALATAALELLTDRAAWDSAQAAGIRRVERYYTQDRMFADYRALYRKAMDAPTLAPRAPQGKR
ncbi:MAG: GT4 family glycosyltransferase PelF [Proteobacteria bacterium]|nr:GT4 family glycosyltransferase PelF [Pseudomonadota bacterium]